MGDIPPGYNHQVADIALETYYSRRKDSFHFGNNLSLVQHLPEQRDNAGRPDRDQALGHGRKNPNRWLGLTGSNNRDDARSPPPGESAPDRRE